uniref:Uncharacterized protein n=1 Tax=Romanomermis culicivorax TaxID=13658 RepID=A0A915K1F7_ROMCU
MHNFLVQAKNTFVMLRATLDSYATVAKNMWNSVLFPGFHIRFLGLKPAIIAGFSRQLATVGDEIPKASFILAFSDETE